MIEVVEALYDALLRYYSTQSNNYITLLGGCGDDAPEIHCALKQSRIFHKPFAATEQDAKERLSAWLEKERLEQYDQASGTQPPHIERGAERCVLDATISPDAITPVASEPPFAITEADAVQALRQRGYHIFHGSVTPPPAYQEHASSSQPARTVIGEAAVQASWTNKRKRNESKPLTQSCPSTPVRGLSLIHI